MRVHQHTTGVKDQAISNNVGGNSSIIYLVVDADGNPIESIFNDSKTHDVKVHLICLIFGFKGKEILCADRSYNSELFREKLRKPKPK